MSCWFFVFFHFLLSEISLQSSNHADRATVHGPEILGIGHLECFIEFVSIFSRHAISQNQPQALGR